MNMFGFIHFNGEVIADGISKRTGRELKLGRMNWQADSYHIYGRDIDQAREMLFNRIGELSIEE
jgi:thymidylate synthase